MEYHMVEVAIYNSRLIILLQVVIVMQSEMHCDLQRSIVPFTSSNMENAHLQKPLQPQLLQRLQHIEEVKSISSISICHLPRFLIRFCIAALHLTDTWCWITSPSPQNLQVSSFSIIILLRCSLRLQCTDRNYVSVFILSFLSLMHVLNLLLL